ncbi:MAG TPA: SulP family inorganic anion transporter [Actinomycetota bacterium]
MAGSPSSLLAGLAIGAVESLLVIAFAAIVFGGRIEGYLDDGIGVYLGAAAVALGVFAWLGGRRGIVAEMQGSSAAVLAIAMTSVALGTHGSPDRAFLTVVAATLVVTMLCGVVLLALGTLRRGNLVRFVPYPVVGGFLAGTGWLLFKGGISVASGVEPALETIGDLTGRDELLRWAPALAFGVVMVLAVRAIRTPMVIPGAVAIGLVAFLIGMVLTGSSLEEARAGGWLLGSFESTGLWEPWTVRALWDADWLAVLSQSAGILVTVFVAVVALSSNVSGTEAALNRDLDTNRELRDAGVLNVVAGAIGGIPGSHARSTTSLAHRMNVDARTAGLMAALVPLAAAFFGAAVIELIPRMLVGGLLVFLGGGFIVEWVWDKRRSLPTVEYVVLLVILAAIVVRGFFPGVVVGLVLAVVLFAISYGRVELVREVAFAQGYHSNVDRPAAERAALRALGDRVQILRVRGFVFFGSANGVLEHIRRRAESGTLRFLLIDLSRVTGVDASAVATFVKAVGLAEARGFELVFAGASDRVRRQLARGGVSELDGVVAFELDLDRGLQRVEDGLLATLPATPAGEGSDGGPAGMPEGLSDHLERLELAEDEVLIRQDEPPTGVFVLESGRLRVEMNTPDGRRMRLRSVLPGVVVGEVALYTGAARTADVVAETPSVVLRLSRASMNQIASQDPALAAALHRWLATTLAERLGDTLRAVDALLG